MPREQVRRGTASPVGVRGSVPLPWGGRARSHADAGNSNVFESVFEGEGGW